MGRDGRPSTRARRGTGWRVRGGGERHRPRWHAHRPGRLLMAATAVVDVDSHVYEPPAVWDRVPADFRSMARSAFYHEVDQEGNRLTIVNGVVGRELNRSRLVRQAIWRPGLTPEAIGKLDPDTFEPLNPGASDPAARLADMDAMAVDLAVV